jgi:hypothetical protein
VIDLAQVRRLVMRPGSGKAVFEVETVGGRTYSLAAQSKNDAQRWVNALNSARGEPTSGTKHTRHTRHTRRTTHTTHTTHTTSLCG